MEVSKQPVSPAEFASPEDRILSAFKNVPSLPTGVKKLLVGVMPYLAIFFACMQVIAAYALWVMYSNTKSIGQYSKYYVELPPVLNETERLISLCGALLLMLDAVILIKAYGGLKAKIRTGWRSLALATFVYALFALLNLFINDHGFGSFFFGAIGSLFAIYILTQIYDMYSLTQPPVKQGKKLKV